MNVLPALRDKLQQEFDVSLVPVPDLHSGARVFYILHIKLTGDNYFTIAQDDNLLKLRVHYPTAPSDDNQISGNVRSMVRNISPIDLLSSDFFEQLLRVIRATRGACRFS